MTAATAAFPTLDATAAQAAVASGARRYFAERRTRVQPFVDRHFSLRGTLALHRHAVGWDIARAPANLTLAGAQAAASLASRAAGRLGARRLSRVLDKKLLLRTAVSKRIDWLVRTELLELPFEQDGQRADRDALAEAILAEPALQQALVRLAQTAGVAAADAAFRARVAAALAEYGVSRAAAAEITTGMLSLGGGLVGLHKITPGAAALGTALAGVLAQQAAVASFPLGAWLGGVWYGLFPVVPAGGLIAASAGGLVLAATTFAAFAGVLADPVQRALGLHRRRLLRMVDALERGFFDPQAAGYALHDQYVARLMDVFNWLGAALHAAGV